MHCTLCTTSRAASAHPISSPLTLSLSLLSLTLPLSLSLSLPPPLPSNLQILFSALIDVAAHAAAPDVALSLLQDMRKAGIKPGPVTFSAQLSMFGRVS